MNYLEIMKERRSIYHISEQISISEEQVIKMVEDAILHSPTGFNMQSGKAVVLMNDEHRKLWDIVMETLRKIVPNDSFRSTEAKINAFKAGKGTVLFFDDQVIIDDFSNQFALYKENFPVFAAHAMGILQANIWYQFTEAEIGASLQHYNPLIDEEVKRVWNIPDSWKLTAQMPFGKIESGAEDKQFNDLKDRIKIFR